MNKKVLLFSTLAVSLGLASCVDDRYDLSNIDTTIGVNVKDLTLAMKLDPIQMQKLVDLEEGDQIQELIDPATGKKVYAVKEEGDFKSDPISIESFTATVPAINAINDQLPIEKINEELWQTVDKAIDDAVTKEINKRKDKIRTDYAGYGEEVINQMLAEIDAQEPAIREEQKKDPEVRKAVQEQAWEELLDKNEVLAKYHIDENATTSFTANSDNVDKSLRDLVYTNVETNLAMTLKLTNLQDILQVTVYDVQIQLPKGLDVKILDKENKVIEAAKYNKADGLLKMGDVPLVGGQYFMNIVITGIDIAQAGIEFTPRTDAKGSFKFASEVCVKSGTVEIRPRDFFTGKSIFDLPEHAAYRCEPSMSSIEVSSITGKIEYAITEPEIESVNMDNLPGMFTDRENRLFLDNPQIYLSVNNPISDEIYAQVGLQLTAKRSWANDITYGLDDNRIVKIKDATNVFCLSPKDPAVKFEGYEGAEHVGFKKLSDLLAGEVEGDAAGLPTSIEINVMEAKIPEQPVTNFKLGRNIPAVEGKYMFYAPMSIGKGSIVQYKDTIDGWFDETIEKLTISKLQLSAKLTSELPVGAELSIKPINKNGEVINGVEFSKVVIEQDAQGNITKGDVLFQMTKGEITAKHQLDGIILKAMLIQNSENASMVEPLQTIELKDIKVTVSGQYIEPDKD